jgi:hypothetical protein
MSKNPFDDDISNVTAGFSNVKTNVAAVPEIEGKTLDSIIKLSSLRDDGVNELSEILMSLRGRKCLVIEPQLGGLLNLILPDGAKGLKEHGVHHIKELRGDEFDSGSGESSSSGLLRDVPDNFVYLVRPNLSMVKALAKQIKAYRDNGEAKIVTFRLVL